MAMLWSMGDSMQMVSIYENNLGLLFNVLYVQAQPSFAGVSQMRL